MGEGEGGGEQDRMSFSRELRNNPTEAERALWRHLRLKQLLGSKFRRQCPLGSYVVDFICFERKLIVELDGGQHAEQFVYDSDRTAWLEAQGYCVLRFWNNQILNEIESVKEVILHQLSKRTPHPSPPPQGGRDGKIVSGRG
jgi:very-short-patch-repair endonuclease